MASWTAGTRLGPYKLRAKAGEGSAATVWLASYKGPGGVRKRVALKLIKGAASKATYDAVCREAQITARLQHPNIVDVLGVEIHDGALMVSMEYLAGGNLRELLRRAEKAGALFPGWLIASLAVDILRALERAHGPGDGRRPVILHRDLKPENVLLDATGRAKLTDFGIAKLLGETGHTAPGIIKGTHRYIPPEVWKGSRDFHPRGDLFAVGCILFELATGRKLFAGGIGAIMDAISDRTSGEEGAMVADTCPAFAPVIERLLRRAPERRYQRAEDVLRDVLAMDVRRQGVDDVAAWMARLGLRRRPAPTLSVEPVATPR